jgi:hypothetical protein
MKKFLVFKQENDILSFLKFTKYVVNTKKDFFYILNRLLKIKIKKKEHFFHSKVNLVSEIILYSIDLNVDKDYFTKEGHYFKGILFNSNILKIHSLGSGFNTNIIFGVLSKLWISYKNKYLSIPRKKGLLLVISSKEDRLQLILSLSYVLEFFSINFLGGGGGKVSISKNKDFFVNLVPEKFFSLGFNPQSINFYECVFIKGEYFIPDYHLILVKLKKFKSFNCKYLQKVLFFSLKVFITTLLRKKNFQLAPNSERFLNDSYFSNNQILDTSVNQFIKIHKIIKFCTEFKQSKVIISSSWGRCLLYCNLMIKSNRKFKLKCKNFQIITMHQNFYIIVNFDKFVQYYTSQCSKKLEFFNQLILFDVCKENLFFLKFGKILKLFKLINLNIYFLLTKNKFWYFKLIKSGLRQNAI